MLEHRSMCSIHIKYYTKSYIKSCLQCIYMQSYLIPINYFWQIFKNRITKRKTKKITIYIQTPKVATLHSLI